MKNIEKGIEKELKLLTSKDIILVETKNNEIYLGVFENFTEGIYSIKKNILSPTSINLINPISIKKIKGTIDEIVEKKFETQEKLRKHLEDNKIFNWVKSIINNNYSEAILDLEYINKGKKKLEIDKIKFIKKNNELYEFIFNNYSNNILKEIRKYVQEFTPIEHPVTISGMKVFRASKDTKFNEEILNKMWYYPILKIDLRNISQGESQRNVSHLLSLKNKEELNKKIIYLIINYDIPNYNNHPSIVKEIKPFI